jgi:hypothetical protein
MVDHFVNHRGAGRFRASLDRSSAQSERDHRHAVHRAWLLQPGAGSGAKIEAKDVVAVAERYRGWTFVILS